MRLCAERYFVFTTATAEKSVLHKQEVAKVIETRRACFYIKEYAVQASLQTHVEDLSVFNFKVSSQKRSINTSFCNLLNIDGTALTEKEFLTQAYEDTSLLKHYLKCPSSVLKYK